MVNVGNVASKQNAKIGVTKKGNSYVKSNNGAKIGASTSAGLLTYGFAAKPLETKKMFKNMVEDFKSNNQYLDELIKMFESLESEEKILNKMLGLKEPTKSFSKKLKMLTSNKAAKAVAIAAFVLNFAMIIGLSAGIGKVVDVCVNKSRAHKADKAAQMNQQA